MKKIITTGLVAVLLILNVSEVLAATTSNTSTKKVTPIKKVVYKAPVASSSDQILAYYKTRPFYSSTTKDRIVAAISTSSIMDVSSLGLYPVTQLRNNQYEEQGNYYLAACENELLLKDDVYNLKSFYSTDSLKNIKTTISGPNGEFSATLNGAWVRGDSYLKVATTTTQRQRDVITREFYTETKDGYAWTMTLKAHVYSPVCAKWMFDREVWTNRSIGGYQFGLDTFYPLGTVFYNVRGEKTIKGNPVEFFYSSSPFAPASSNPTYEEGLFYGSTGKTAPRTQDFYYVFRKGNVMYNVSLSTDKPASHLDADKIISGFFN